MEIIFRLLDKIKNKEIVVPEFQREYIWSKQQAKDLLDSLYKKWPTGSLLFWKVKKNEAPPLKKVRFDSSETARIELILDGQQRLTALYLLITGEVPPYYNENEIAYDPRDLCFNIVDQTFEYYQEKKMKNDPAWQKVTWFFKANTSEINELIQKLKEKSGQDYSSTIWREHSWLKSRLLTEGSFPIQTIPEDASELDSIKIFHKINTQGTKLSKEELALAYIQNNWRSARKELKKYLAELRKMNFDFDLTFLVRCLTAVVRGSGRPQTIHDAQESELLIGWTKVKNSLDYLVRVLSQEAYIHSEDDLISTRTLIPMVLYLSKNNYHFSQEEKCKFLRWMYLVTLWSWYSASPESRMDSDVRIVDENKDPVHKMIDSIKRQRSVLTVEPKDLEQVGMGTGFEKMTLIVAKSKKAVDWFIGTPLSSNAEGHYSIERHHIFPLSVLYNERFPEKNLIQREKVNEVANRAFIIRKTNRTITNTKPINYLQNINDEFPGALEAQFVPMNENLWKVENYDKFLAERRRLIASAINEFIDSYRKTGLDRLSLDDLLEEEEGQHLEFKSTLRVDLKNTGVTYKILENEVLESIVAFLNQDNGGILIIGFDDDNKIIVGLEKDYNTLPKKNLDSFLLHLTQIIGSRIGRQYHDNIKVNFQRKEGKDVAIITVKKAHQFVAFNDKNYIRENNRTVSIPPAEAAEYIRKVWG